VTLSSDQKKLQRETRIFGWLARAGFWLTVLCVSAVIVASAAPIWKGGDARQALANVGVQAILAAPALFFAVALLRARQLFRRVGAGEMLTPENSRGLAAVGMWVLAGAVWALADAGLTPPQSDQIAVQLGQIGVAARDMALAALGLALIMIGRMLAAAASLKAENDGFL